MASIRFSSIILVSAILRLILILYGEWQDTHMEVRYTDIDYLVFSDAASLMASGKSPFLRSTYRYSPLLAFLLLPNSFIHRSWGKFLFSASGTPEKTQHTSKFFSLTEKKKKKLFSFVFWKKKKNRRFACGVLDKYDFEAAWSAWKLAYCLSDLLALQSLYLHYWDPRELWADCLCHGSLDLFMSHERCEFHSLLLSICFFV